MPGLPRQRRKEATTNTAHSPRSEPRTIYSVPHWRVEPFSTLGDDLLWPVALAQQDTATTIASRPHSVCTYLTQPPQIQNNKPSQHQYAFEQVRPATVAIETSSSSENGSKTPGVTIAPRCRDLNAPVRDYRERAY